MNLEHLQRFLLVIERGSIGEAARDLGISQAAMSKSIQRLEASVRTKLFERTKNGMVPNVYGVALMRRAQSLILSAEKAAVEIREMLEGTSGRVRVSIAPSFASTSAMPVALMRFRQGHPKVLLDVVEEPPQQAEAGIRSGEIDFAVGTVHSALSYEGMVVETLYLQDVIVAARSRHPLALRRRLTPPDLWAFPWMLAHGTIYLAKLKEVFLSVGLRMPEGGISYVSNAFAKNMLRHTDFLSLIARVSVELEVEAGALAILDAPDFRMKRTVGILYRDGVGLKPAAEMLIKLIREATVEYREREKRAV